MGPVVPNYICTQPVCPFVRGNLSRVVNGGKNLPLEGVVVTVVTNQVVSMKTPTNHFTFLNVKLYIPE